jgi:tetratricopeptide (TPR) repeat protein
MARRSFLIRCAFLLKQRIGFLASLAFSLCLLFSVPSASAQVLLSDPVSEDKELEGTFSLRDSHIPFEAYADFQRGLQRLEKHDPARGEKFFKKAVELYPAYYEAYYHLGLAQKRLGQSDEAAASFRKTIELSGGKYVLADYAYALQLCMQGKATEAERIVREALAMNQNKPVGEVVLGTVLMSFHRVEEAEKSARQALSLDPAAYDAYLILASVHSERSDYPAEVQDLDSFLALEPDGARADQVRGMRNSAESLANHTASK